MCTAKAVIRYTSITNRYSTVSFKESSLFRLYQTVDACDNWFSNSFRGSVVLYRECPGDQMVTIRGDRKFR